jgi:transcriptional regulator with XRE-family HTH domain
MELIERIELKSKEIGYTIMKLEKESGLSNGQIRKWRTQKPSYDKVASVANTLNVSIDWLITGKESKDLSPEEQKLVEYYRQSDDRGKRNIIRVAEQESQEVKSSNCKIG